MKLSDEFSTISDFYSPKIIGEVNDVYVKLVRAKGDDIPWHNHENEDELFLILEGGLLFEVEGQEPFMLKAGELFIVKKGVNHRVSCEEECRLMLIEPKSTAHTGDVDAPITKSVEEQKKG